MDLVMDLWEEMDLAMDLWEKMVLAMDLAMVLWKDMAQKKK